jgi:hypothetical protein
MTRNERRSVGFMGVQKTLETQRWPVMAKDKKEMTALVSAAYRDSSAAICGHP